MSIWHTEPVAISAVPSQLGFLLRVLPGLLLPRGLAPAGTRRHYSDPMLQRGSQFSLAGALFGWPPAPGHTAPDEQVPDAWILQFSEQYVEPDPAVLSGLFCSCRAGRDGVLRTADCITLTLDTTTPQPLSAWQRRLQVVGQGHAGKDMPTTLHVLCNTSTHSAAQCASIPALASAHSDTIAGLAVHDKSHGAEPSPVFASVLQLCAAAAHKLVYLETNSTAGTLPPPAHVPMLRELRVVLVCREDELTAREQDACRSIGALVPQLTHLTVTHVLPFDVLRLTDGPWEPIFTPQTTSHTLTTLTTNAILDDELMTLLLDHAPALEHVECYMLETGSVSHMGREWGVCELVINDAQNCEECLQFLPKCKEGKQLRIDAMFL